MTTFENLTLLGILATIIISIFSLIYSYASNKKLKRYEIWLGEVPELNRKMHDGLEDVKDSLNSNTCPSDKTRERLIKNASRIKKYESTKNESTIYSDVECLIQLWTKMFPTKEIGSINAGYFAISKQEIFTLIENIEVKVDNVLKI